MSDIPYLRGAVAELGRAERLEELHIALDTALALGERVQLVVERRTRVRHGGLQLR